jgi:hypothetical protein
MVRVPERAFIPGQKPSQHIERMKDIIEKYILWMDSQAKWCAKSLIESSLENSKIGKMFEQDRVSKYLKGFRFLGPAETKQPDEAYVFDVSFSDLLGDEYETKTWKEERDSLNKNDKSADLTVLLEQPLKNYIELNDGKNKTSDIDDKIAPKPTEEQKTQMINSALKSDILSDAAKAALASEKKLKDIRSESIDEFYNRICIEYDNNDLLKHIERRTKTLEDTDNQFIQELMTYELHARRNEMKATTESHKQFMLAEKEKKRAILESVIAPSHIVEMPPVQIDNTLFNPNDNNSLDIVIKASNELDTMMLNMDDGFVFA